jgi:protoporphyrinogen/coproporphyrinogen III oxidase
MRLLKEYFVPARVDTSDESLESFVVRRLGREAYDRLVEPIIGGIFTAKGSTLSMQAALPQFVMMEQKYGGLIKAQRAKRDDTSEAMQSAKRASGARYDQFITHPDGMSAWIQSIADKIPSQKIRLGRKVERLVPIDSSSPAISTSDGSSADLGSSNHETKRWIVVTRQVAESGENFVEETLFDAVIVACPAKPASELLKSVNEAMADELTQIPYAGSAVIAMLVDRNHIDPNLICFGIVVPQIEKLDTLAISFTSEKYPGRTPSDKVLLRVFMGGAVRPELLRETDEELFKRGWSDVQRLLKLSKPPSWHRVIRWNEAMPQYIVGHMDRLAGLERELESLPTLALAGNAYRGVGIPQCVRSGRQAATRILNNLGLVRP